MIILLLFFYYVMCTQILLKVSEMQALFSEVQVTIQNLVKNIV